MASIRRARAVLTVFLAVALCGLVLAGSRSAAAPVELLPDIVPKAPKELTVQPNGSGGYRLGFEAAFENRGSGPLRIEGHKVEASEQRMVADQVITRSDGSTRTEPKVGEFRFEDAEDYRHWHLKRFMSYELLRPEDGEPVASDRKIGFCVLDLYDADASVRLPGEPPLPGAFDPPPERVFCGRDDPERTSLTMDLSVGYADNYRVSIDGQSVDVTGVPEGRYLLVHRVETGPLESDYETRRPRCYWSCGGRVAPRNLRASRCSKAVRTPRVVRTGRFPYPRNARTLRAPAQRRSRLGAISSQPSCIVRPRLNALEATWRSYGLSGLSP